MNNDSRQTVKTLVEQSGNMGLDLEGYIDMSAVKQQKQPNLILFKLYKTLVQ